MSTIFLHLTYAVALITVVLDVFFWRVC